MTWPPEIGQPLPRAEYVFCTDEKLTAWVLGKGHGREWSRVFRVTVGDHAPVWAAIAEATVGAEVITVRDRRQFDGSWTCSVRPEVTVHRRTAPVVLVWSYASEHAAPRLVSAYPTP